MNSTYTLFTLVAIGCAIAGCNRNANTSSVFSHISVIDGTGISIHVAGTTDATVTANGSLTIGGHSIAVTASQRELLAAYVAGAIGLRTDAIANGAAGVATAGQAISSVVSGLSSGKPDQIGPAVEARAARVETQAAKICADLSALRKTQEMLVTQLEAFQPYATIEAADIAECTGRG